MPIDSYSVDFAALRTLRLVYEHRSFTVAAQKLEANQSAVSYTIDKLRRTFDDPLFVRQGGAIAATDRCVDIVAQAVELLEMFEAMTQEARFDPASTRARVTIACNYYERQLILPSVVTTLRSAAPGVALDIVASTSLGRQQLLHSEADLLIGPIRPEEEGFFCRNLLQERYVCVMDPANPFCARSLTLEDYVAAPHATITYGGAWKSGYLVQLEALERTLNAALTLPSPSALQETLSGTDLIATVPERLARNLAPGLHVTESPVPAPFGIDLVWTLRTHSAPVHTWLRNMIAAVVKSELR